MVRVKIARNGYNGAVKLGFLNLPTSVSITGDEIPAGATEALVSLSAPGLSPAQAVRTSSARAPSRIPRSSDRPRCRRMRSIAISRGSRDEVGLAVTRRGSSSWFGTCSAPDVKLAQGTALPIKVRAARGCGRLPAAFV